MQITYPHSLFILATANKKEIERKNNKMNTLQFAMFIMCEVNKPGRRRSAAVVSESPRGAFDKSRNLPGFHNAVDRHCHTYTVLQPAGKQTDRLHIW